MYDYIVTIQLQKCVEDIGTDRHNRFWVIIYTYINRNPLHCFVYRRGYGGFCQAACGQYAREAGSHGKAADQTSAAQSHHHKPC